MTNNESVIYIVDDDPAVRDSLRMLIKRLGLTIKTYASGEAFLSELCPETTGCIVLDMRMEGMSGFDLQEALIEMSVDLPIIFITGFGDVPLAVRATRRGAMDFIEKPFEQDLLLKRIQEAVKRDTKNRQARAERIEIKKRFETLSPREREVMELVVSGKTSREIAEILCRSEKTVKAHRLHLMKKIQARTAAELVGMAIIFRESDKPRVDNSLAPCGER